VKFSFAATLEVDAVKAKLEDDLQLPQTKEPREPLTLSVVFLNLAKREAIWI